MGRIMDGQFRSTHTSDYVVAECLNFIQARRGRRETAMDLQALLFGGPGLPPLVGTIHKVHGNRFAAALDSYLAHFAAGLSLTDWTSLVLMREQGIEAIATFDRGFRGRMQVVDR